MSTTSKHSKPTHKARFSFPSTLIDKHRRTQRKIDSLKAKERLRESSTSRSTPKINTFSRKLVKKSETLASLSRMERTQQVLQHSRFMPKNLKVSLSSLQSAELPAESKEALMENCYNIVSHRSDSPKFYPSLMQHNKVLGKTQSLPSDIELRNEALYNLKNSSKVSERITAPPDMKDINQRSSFWLMKKQKRIEEAKALKDRKAVEGCTFRPDVRKSANGSLCKGGISSRSNSSVCTDIGKKRRGGSKSVSSVGRLAKPNSSMSSTPRSFLNENPYFELGQYSKVSPIKMKLAYEKGYSAKLKAKFKPMIDYRDIRFQTS